MEIPNLKNQINSKIRTIAHQQERFSDFVLHVSVFNNHKIQNPKMTDPNGTVF
jgi:hypothetical protein